MKIKARVLVIAAGFLISAGLVADDLCSVGLLSSEAQAARVYRPVARPHSAAGAARRTTRRRIHRTNVYVTTLPAGCSTEIIDGTKLYNCGGTHYQADGSQYVVVSVD